MEIYVASKEISRVDIMRDREKLEVRGGGEVLELKELLESINKKIKESIENECEVKIEIKGSVSISGKGGINWGVLNLGGSGEKKDSVTISLTTKLVPTS
jgi:hypothetical protein